MDHEEPSQRVRWAPRVRPALIVRLYQADARGLIDADLIDEVGSALDARCRSILMATDALHGRVHCPTCGAIVARADGDPARLLRCPACGWAMTWGRYHQGFRHQELTAAGLLDAIQAFRQGWARAPGPREKMLLIDRLIHRWHWEASQEHLLGRPSAVNLIEGNRASVIALLDQLSHGPDSTTGTRDTHQTWQATRRRVAAQARRPRPD
jgi:predicted RNA-binding Zn-ribbon protein involved in translation (DUF1610 family)